MGILGSLAGGVLGGLGSMWSGNEYADDIRDATKMFVTPYANTGQQANTFLQDFLLNQGGRGQLEAFNQSTGGQFLMDQGRRAIGGNMAAQGKLNSGATGKALTEFGQNLASTQMQNFLNQIGGLAGRGLSAGNSALAAYGDAAGAQAEGRSGAGGVLGDLLGSIF
jgi:hypothetical protein